MLDGWFIVGQANETGGVSKHQSSSKIALNKEQCVLPVDPRPLPCGRVFEQAEGQLHDPRCKKAEFHAMDLRDSAAALRISPIGVDVQSVFPIS